MTNEEFTSQLDVLLGEETALHDEMVEARLNGASRAEVRSIQERFIAKHNEVREFRLSFRKQ